MTTEQQQAACASNAAGHAAAFAGMTTEQQSAARANNAAGHAVAAARTLTPFTQDGQALPAWAACSGTSIRAHV